MRILQRYRYERGRNMNGKVFDKIEQMDLFGESEQEQVDNSLNARYIVPPFSVLDTKQGYWQNRKRRFYQVI